MSLNHDYMKTENFNVVFECLQKSPALTKRDLVNRTSLSWTTVSTAVTQLIQSRLLIEQDPDVGTLVGRPPKIYDINDSDFFIIGIDVNVEGLKAVVIDFKARVIITRNEMLCRNDKKYVLETLTNFIATVLSDECCQNKTIVGIGIAMMGSIDTHKGISKHVHLFSDWENVNLKEIIQDRFGLPVFVEHDPNCMALSEMMICHRNHSHMLFLRISYGVGLSIIINNEIYRGFSQNEGNLEAVTFNNSFDPQEKALNINDIVSASGIVSRYRSTNSDSRFSDSNDANSVFAMLRILGNAARDGNPQIKKLFTDAGICLGITLSSLDKLFDPESIILGGVLFEYSDLFMDVLREQLLTNSASEPVPVIELSDCGNNGAAIGAALLFIKSRSWIQYYD